MNERCAGLEEWGHTSEAEAGGLDALGVEVRVWKTDHEPRYVISVPLPIDGD